MITANFTSRMKDMFNKDELQFISGRAEEMLQGKMVQWFFSVGKHDVCIERDSVDKKSISISTMNIPFRINESNVNAYNKRKKNKKEETK